MQEATTTPSDPDIDVQGPGTVYLNIMHSCGHTGRLLFGGYEHAARQKKQYQDWSCNDCLERERQAAHLSVNH